jgi:hypothetical protein
LPDRSLSLLSSLAERSGSTLAWVAPQQAAFNHESHASIDQNQPEGAIPEPGSRRLQKFHWQVVPSNGCQLSRFSELFQALTNNGFTQQAKACREQKNPKLGFDVPADLLRSHDSLIFDNLSYNLGLGLYRSLGHDPVHQGTHSKARGSSWIEASVFIRPYRSCDIQMGPRQTLGDEILKEQRGGD